MKKFFTAKLYKLLLNRIYNPFFAMNVKPVEFIPKKGDKYLVTAPHPDDESIGCGGIMNSFPECFDVICLTHGADDDVRKQEFENAMSVAGIKNHKMLNIPDKHVISGQKEFNSVDISSYDIIFIPYLFDQHKDHKAVSILLAEKLKNSSHKKELKIAFYEVWSTINMPNVYFNISDTVELKKAMINCHKSQIVSKNYADKILDLNSYRGLLKNLDAAEAFSLMSVPDFLKIVSKIVYDTDNEQNEKLR